MTQWGAPTRDACRKWYPKGSQIDPRPTNTVATNIVTAARSSESFNRSARQRATAITPKGAAAANSHRTTAIEPLGRF